MNPFHHFKKSLAAKLMLAFMLVAALPMLAASHVATRLVHDAANVNIGRWLHEAFQYLFNTIDETAEEIAATYTMLSPRFAQPVVSFTPEELEALAKVDIDCIVLKDQSGGILFATPSLQSLADTPLFPGSAFRWATRQNGEKELIIVVQRTITAQDGSKRILDLGSQFSIRLAESGSAEPLELRIFLPDGGGFRQEYASTPDTAPYALPVEALAALKAGATEYTMFSADWINSLPDQYVLLTPVRNEQGAILAIFVISAHLLPSEGIVSGYFALFWSFFAGGILLSGCIGYVLARRLTKPLRQLNKGVREIAAGNFSGRVTPLGNDEVAELSNSFNITAGQLELMQRESVQSARHERSRMLGEIALGFAHEIRNPLLVIKTSAELVHGKLPDDGKESRLLGLAIEEVGRIDSLIAEFLSFAKPAPFTPTFFRLDTLAQDVLELSAAEFAAKNIVCSFVNETPNTQEVRVLGEENKIRQALLNLVLNGAEAMPDGGSLVVRLYHPEAGDRVCLDVTDTGSGIPEDLLPTMHLPFISTKKSGLGLGLAKTYAIVEEHGGSITCESALGQGTTFSVYLNS
ncbi:MAG: ATP-binding protein [Desulfobulbus sp.]|nr:ATP-binding protein [Desulfobulbus sp.]